MRYLCVGQSVADTAVELVEGFPFELRVAFVGGGEETRGLVCAFEGAGPDDQLAVVPDAVGDEPGESLGVEFAAGGEVGVAADLAGEIILGFTMLML